LGQYQQRLEEAMRMLEGMGTQQRKDLAQRYRAAESVGMQDLVSRGLTGTTILPTMRMGYQREHENALGRLNESLRGQRLGVYGQLSGDLAGAMQSDYWQGQQMGLNQQRLGLEQQRINMMGRYGGRRRRRPAGGMYGLGNQAVFASRGGRPNPGSAAGLPQIQAYRRMYG
jgi:hypothetical protein